MPNSAIPPLQLLPLHQFLAQTAAKTPTPGGGAVACVTGALAAALGQMVVNYSVGKKNLAEFEPSLRDAVARLERARGLLMQLADEDAAAYGAVNELSRLPEWDPRRVAELPDAQAASVQVPLATAAACVDLLRLFQQLVAITNKHLLSDLRIAAILADAGVRASGCNVLVNTASLPGEQQTSGKGALAALVAESGRLLGLIEASA